MVIEPATSDGADEHVSDCAIELQVHISNLHLLNTVFYSYSICWRYAYVERRGRNEASFFFESKLAKFYEEGMRNLMTELLLQPDTSKLLGKA
ncbi:hypothetical protein ACTXT7_014188 [Hymenolepis weldensis]